MSLWRKPNRKWMLGIPIGGLLAFILGGAAISVFHFGMDYTNSNEFCYSCHIGMDTIVEEYQASPHFKSKMLRVWLPLRAVIAMSLGSFLLKSR